MQNVTVFVVRVWGRGIESVCMCGLCDAWVCMCGLCNVRVSLCVDYVMCG